MRKVIQIKVGDIELEAVLNDSGTADAIWEVLPLKARFNTWGDEIYFSIPVSSELENGQELVEVGDLGYWPQGNAFCIFFGPTPMSRGEEVRPASAVTVFGKIIGDSAALRRVDSGAEIIIKRKPD